MKLEFSTVVVVVVAVPAQNHHVPLEEMIVSFHMRCERQGW